MEAAAGQGWGTRFPDAEHPEIIAYCPKHWPFPRPAELDEAPASPAAALAAEEWESGHVFHWDAAMGREPDGSVYIAGHGALDDKIIIRSPEARKAIAALCLHDQAFGFLSDDAQTLETAGNLLLSMARQLRVERSTTAISADEIATQLHAIAERIESLVAPSRP